MKLYIKTNDEWFITESSLVAYNKKEKAQEISVTESEYKKIVEQYDTKVSDWKIISQTKWDNAKILEEEKMKEEQEKLAREQAESEESSRSAE